ncbi:MAG: YicC/YloC family endoribonuclease [Nitrospiraceae bacterium]
MTGFGKKTGVWNQTSVSVEMRSVNHRFLEVAVRVPRIMSDLEDGIRKTVQQRCRRGRVDVTVSTHGGRQSSRSVHLDRDLAKQYHQALRALQKELHMEGTVDLSVLAGFRELFSVSDQPVETSHMRTLVRRLTAGALTDLERMRRKEGQALAKDLLQHIRTLKECHNHIAERVPHITRETFARMKNRVAQLMATDTPDHARLLQELAVYADRSDISEELVRLSSHMLQFEDTLKSPDTVGKTLEFLLQEVGREVNTIGAKANDASIAQLVIRMKAEVEKLREQIQNVE